MDERFRGDFGVRLGQVPIDTVAACFGMKNEDDNAEATKVCNVMRSIGEDIGALMAPVHHYGKNPESGLRGASAWRGCADIVQGVLADIHPLTGRASNRELVCAKARDGEEGPLSAFALEFIELGMDADNEPYGSCCVIPANGASRFDKTTAGSKGKLAILDAINETLDGQGKVICPRAGMASVRAAKVGDVHAEFNRRYVVPDTDPKKAAHAKRMAFTRALNNLSPGRIRGRFGGRGGLHLEGDMKPMSTTIPPTGNFPLMHVTHTSHPLGKGMCCALCGCTFMAWHSVHSTCG